MKFSAAFDSRGYKSLCSMQLNVLSYRRLTLLVSQCDTTRASYLIFRETICVCDLRCAVCLCVLDSINFAVANQQQQHAVESANVRHLVMRFKLFCVSNLRRCVSVCR